MTTKTLKVAKGEEGIDRINSPEWTGDRFRWEHYVPSRIRKAWNGLSADARLVAYVFASEAAESDDPDRDFR